MTMIGDTGNTPQNQAILDARPPWLQLVQSGLKGPPTPWRPIQIPGTPPTNICIECIRRAIFYWAAAAGARVQQRRVIECPHTSADGSRYNVAFAREGKPASWLELAEVDPAAMNELVFNLELRNGRPRNSLLTFLGAVQIRKDVFTDDVSSITHTLNEGKDERSTRRR